MAERTNTAKWDEKRNCWRIIVKRDGVTKSFYSSKRGRTGQREANAKADDWLAGVTPDERIKVAAAYEKYQASQTGLKSTANDIDIASKGRTWITPYIGKRYLDSLSLGDLQDIIDDAARKGKSKKTMRNIRGRLSSFFKYCRKHGWTTLLTDDLEIPTHAPSREKTILQPDALQVLFTVSTYQSGQKRKYDDYINAYRLQVITGLRPGEMLGLKWGDIDSNAIHVQRAINLYGEVTRGKNDNAVRNVPINDLARQILHDQRILSKGDDYVFDNIHTEQNYLRRWHKYCESNGLPSMTVYELRHTFVSITASALPEGAIKSIVGHSKSMDTFGVYMHAVKGDDAKNAEILEHRFAELINKQA